MKATSSLVRIFLAFCLASALVGAAASAQVGKDLASNCDQPTPKFATSALSSPCPPPPPPPPTCNGTPGEWSGCRGNGCAVCSELVADYPLYFANHPLCTPNDTCGGQYYTCNAACPAPTPDDICVAGDVNQNGIPGDIGDAVLLNSFLACTAELEPQQITNSDVNGDCLVDQADADCLMDLDCEPQACVCGAPEVCRCNLPGDVNLNGIPGDIADVVLLNSFLACTAELEPEQITNSDVNGDCLVDQADADCLLEGDCEPLVCVCGDPEVCRCNLPGDVNLNAIPGDIGDVVLLINFLGCTAELEPEQITNSDVNGDCAVDAADVDCLLEENCGPLVCVCADPYVAPCE